MNNAGVGIRDSVADMDTFRVPRIVRNQFLRHDHMHAGGGARHARRRGRNHHQHLQRRRTHSARFRALYSASKFAMNALGKAARMELKRDGIQVMTVCPGYVSTDFGEN